jgi:hypothetical protein
MIRETIKYKKETKCKLILKTEKKSILKRNDTKTDLYGGSPIVDVHPQSVHEHHNSGLP